MYLDGKVVLVTGGTGSFGKKFVELVLREQRPQKLIVFSRDELKQSDMAARFPDGSGLPMRYFVGDVRDRARLERAFHGVDIVVHAAALKQVPSCEYNPFEAVQTNTLGAKNVIDAAIDRDVKKVLMISTDKAVNPINLYGATKLCAEKLFVQGNAYSGAGGTRFGCARYGNVVGTRGSVVPLFLKQRADGFVTLTDKRMTRFWLTLEQGVRFVLRCLERMHGGEIFIPKIPSMRIVDLAEAIAPGCEQRQIGIRSGEKLHEVLVSEDEARHSVELEDMYVVQPTHRFFQNGNYSQGQPLPEGFRYASDSNSRWLSREELTALVGDSTPAAEPALAVAAGSNHRS